jgi:hypothetical protein
MMPKPDPALTHRFAVLSRRERVVFLMIPDPRERGQKM